MAAFVRSSVAVRERQTVGAIQLSEIERLAAAEAPDLADAIISLLEDGDPYVSDVPEGAVQLDEVLRVVRNSRRQFRDETERKTKVHEIWTRFLGQTNPPLPPRFGLADLVVGLYESGNGAGRATVLELAKRAPLKFGLWAGLKRLYKIAERSLDAELFGVLAWRFDTSFARPAYGSEVGKGTLLYLRRRAWRFLRNLGRQQPALYPQFAVQALRHYQDDSPSLNQTWIPNHVLFHESRSYNANGFSLYGDQDDLLKNRAFDETWKRAPAPLMYLLETCESDRAAKFAIQSLRRDFPGELRKVSPAWLARLAHRTLESAHDFLVETLQASPEYHQGKLKAQGLHDAVLQLLTSPSDKARTYAIEYARGHAQDLSAAKLLELAACDHEDTKEFAAKALQGRPAKSLGYAMLGKALGVDGLEEWAGKALNEGFDRNEIPEAFRLEMIFGSDSQRSWVVEWFKTKFQPGEVPVAFWKQILEDKRSEDEYDAGELAQEMLSQVAPAQIGAAWMLDHLGHGYWGDSIGEWLADAESLPDLDVERVKGLVFDRSRRALALQILGKQKLVKPRDLGLPWLLALARREDAQLHDFAHRYLLEHMEPADFGDQATKGIDRLFTLATGKREPEPVRVFAQTYLRCHHPVIGPEQAESKQFSLTPKVPREEYTPDRLWTSLFDGRPDVRKFAVAVTRAELRRWGHHRKVYDLADSEHKEVRNIAYDALLKAGEPTADENATLTPEELDADRVFGMTESRIRSTREVAMDLIRRHYARLGGPDRLAWLMQSNDRTVRMLAVRLLWEKHRPRSFPDGWKPRVPTLGSTGSTPTPGGGGSGGPAPAPPPAAAAGDEDEDEDESLDESDEDEDLAEEDAGEDEDEELSEDDEDLDEEDESDEDDDEELDEDDEDEDLDGGDDEDDEEEEASDASGGSDRDRIRVELLKLVHELDLEDEAQEALDAIGVSFVGELVQFSTIELAKTVPASMIEALEDVLADMGLSFGMKHEPWWPEQIQAKDAVPREELEAEYDDGDEDEGTVLSEHNENTVLEAEIPGVRCPRCAWVPHEHDHWLCSCGFRWNTFRTRGKCPSCNKQWTETACLKCKEMSPHADFWFAETQTLVSAPESANRLALVEQLEADIDDLFDALPERLQDKAWDWYGGIADLAYVGDLAQFPRARVVEQAGEKLAAALEQLLRERGLSFGMIRESWWPEIIEPYASSAGEGSGEEDAGEAEEEDDEDDETTVDDEDLEETVVSRPSGEKRAPAQAAARSASGGNPPPPVEPDPGASYSGPFRDTDALRDFLRRILYGLPPGRSMEPKDDVNVRRHLPANVAKKNAIEVVRDLAIEDVAFAKLVAPVLSEFTGSIAKGEWQACLTALVQIANEHPGIDVPGLSTKTGKA